MLFSKHYDALIASYKAEITDLRAALERQREEHEKREQALLDRLLAVTNPPAARMFNLPPAPPPREPRVTSQGAARVHWPGTDFGETATVVHAEDKK